MCIILLFVNCQRDDEVIEEVINETITPRNETITFDELPQTAKDVALDVDNSLLRLRETVFRARSAARNSIQLADPNIFGEIDPSTVNVLNEDNHMSSYTMRLLKMSDGTYFDNVVIQERKDGSFETVIIRYRPEPNWFAAYDSQYPRFDTYNGRIEFYNVSGVFIAGSILREGDVVESIDLNTDIGVINQGIQKFGDQNIASEAGGGGSTCSIVPQYAGLLQNGIFYVTDIRYTITCFGGGPSGNPGNGSTGSGSGEGSGGSGFGDPNDPNGSGGGFGTTPLADEQGDEDCPPGYNFDSLGNCVLQCNPGFVPGPNGTCVKKPCADVDVLNNTPAYESQINSLETKTGLNQETGSRQQRDGSFVGLNVNPNTDGNSLNFDFNNDTVGFVHTHLDKKNAVRMFSPEDLRSFLEMVRNGSLQGIPVDEFYGTIVTSEGVYTLKFEGPTHSLPIINPSALKSRYQRYMQGGKLEKGFLKFLNDPAVNVPGVSVHKTQTDETVDKLTLNGNSVEEEPCF